MKQVIYGDFPKQHLSTSFFSSTSAHCPNMIRHHLAHAIEAMVNCNLPIPSDSTSSSFLLNTETRTAWKVLVYDTYCQSIISPVLHVAQLKQLGVTLFRVLDGNLGDPLPRIPAIYFVRPTLENITLLVRDISNLIYQKFYINFSSPISNQLLKSFADQLVEHNCSDRVESIFDQHLEIFSPCRNLFHFNLPHSYSILQGQDEYTANSQVDLIVQHLFSVFSTCGVVPYIVMPNSTSKTPAHIIGTKLFQAIESHIKKHKNQHLFLPQNHSNPSSKWEENSERPTLVLYDRHFDVISMVQHIWTFHSLIADIFPSERDQIGSRIGISSFSDDTNDTSTSTSTTSTSNDNNPQNAQTIAARNKLFGKPKKLSVFQLDEDGDAFWNVNRIKNFSSVTIALRNAYVEFQESADTHKSSLKDLASTIDSMPQLQDRKKKLDMHTEICSTILNHIAARNLDVFITLEQVLISTRSLNSKQEQDLFNVLSLPFPQHILKSPTPLQTELLKKMENDRISGFIVYFILVSPNRKNKEILKALSKPIITPVAEYSKMISTIEKHLTSISKFGNYSHLATMKPSQSTSSLKSLGQGLGTFTNSFFSAAQKMTQQLVGSAGSYSTEPAIHKLVENISQGATTTFVKTDPIRTNVFPTRPSKFVVFCVGAGSLFEFYSLKRLQEKSPHITSLSYGAPGLLNPQQFISEIGALSK